MSRHRREDHRLKTLLAQECARIIAEEGIPDFRSAKRKAMLRLGIADQTALPDNAEIEQALLDHQRLFHADRQARQLRRLRETALDAMRFLASFRPRLVGPALTGAVGLQAELRLHLFADTPQEILLFLTERGIPVETGERRLRMSNGAEIRAPVFRFSADDQPVELTVFPLVAEREAPCSPVDGRPMRRARLAEVEALLAAGGS